MRIVFDASSSETGYSSLNDQLSAGDNIVADLLTTLLRIRSNKIAIVADIEKAFLQIALAKNERDSHRFLWYESTPNLNSELPPVAEFRRARVTFGVTSSPFLLSATIQNHLEKAKPQYGDICDKLKKSFYVGDLVLSEREREVACVRIKIILQCVWKANTEWDHTLCEHLLSDFQCWQEELKLLSELTIKRCLSSNSEFNTELHIFAVVSPKAYGAVAYIKQTSADGLVSTNLICSKNRVTPIEKDSANNELSLPKLELTAALIAAGLKGFLLNSLDFKINNIYLWTYSSIALNWIFGNGKPLQPYVKSRVSEINQLTNIYDWRHCDNYDNRLKGLPEAEIGNMITQPIILPKNSRFIQLVILEAHKATLHGGVNAVLSHIRKRYWIVQGRQLIKNTLQRCMTCKRLHGKSASEPWTVLTAAGVVTTRPFETTGVDFAGPLHVKSEGDGNQRKVYIMLLTCAAIRAIHMELVSDMTVKSCIEALRRFIARRGVPANIISDNPKTFKRADLELRKLEELMKNNEVQRLAADRGIMWKYIPERAAWWGGFWERFVKTVKNALKAAIGKVRLTSDELKTLLTEVESVVNARPLTYITDDKNDLESLTPAHFLINCNSSLILTNTKTDGSALEKSWQLRQVIIMRYMKRWREEYLQQLRSIHHDKSKPIRSISVGDIVLVHEDNKPRLQWKLAVVQTRRGTPKQSF